MAPISEAHRRLGRAMRNTRVTAGITTRNVAKLDSEGFYSSAHISLVENGLTAPSPELVDTYASMGTTGAELRSLYQQVIAATQNAARRRRRGNPQASMASDELLGTPPRIVTAQTDRRDVEQHYVAESYDAHYRFGQFGEVLNVRCEVALRAKTRGVCLYHSGFTYPADPRKDVLKVEPLRGCTVSESRESASGALDIYFRLDHELSPLDAKPHVVAFLVNVDTVAKAAPRLRYFADAGKEELNLTATFHPSTLPQLLWWFAAPDVIDAEHLVADHELANHDATYNHQFSRLVPGWCYGFNWIW